MDTQDVKVKKTRVPKPKEPKPKEPKMNAWTHHVKNYCIEHDIKYRDAMRSEECKSLYHKTKSELVE